MSGRAGAATLRVGIVGTGAMAAYHAKRFASIPGVAVTACADRDPDRAAAFASANGIARVFTDADALAASGEVEAVAVSSRDGWHVEPVLAALDRGLPVFCEKPLARSLEAARHMASAANRAGVPALVNFSKRNGGLLALARELLRGGELGALRGIELSYLQSWLLQDSWGDWRDDPRWQWRLDDAHSTFGALGDLGSHLFDAALYLFGAVFMVSCETRRFEPPAPAPWLSDRPSPESFAARVEAAGMEGRVVAGYGARGKTDAFAVRLRGERKELVIDFDRSREALFLSEGNGAAVKELRPAKLPSTYDRFVALARGDLDPIPDDPVDFAQGLAVQALVEEAALSALAVEAGSGAGTG